MHRMRTDRKSIVQLESATLLEVMLGLVWRVSISILYLENREVSDTGKLCSTSVKPEIGSFDFFVRVASEQGIAVKYFM